MASMSIMDLGTPAKKSETKQQLNSEQVPTALAKKEKIKLKKEENSERGEIQTN